MEQKLIAVVGLSGTEKSKLVGQFAESENSLIVDFMRETENILAPGGEAYRQIINYFGEDYLLKTGKLNTKKLWKFVYGDQNKLRILNYLIEPLLLNNLQKILDLENAQRVLVLMPGLIDKELYKRFAKVIWIDLPKEIVLKKLASKILPVSVDQYYDVQSRLFLKPLVENLFIWNGGDSEMLRKMIFD